MATPQKSTTPSANARRIFYVGNDSAYWVNLQSRYKTIYAGKEFYFKSFPATDKETYQNTIANILINPPHIVYIDLSFSKDYQIKVGSFVRRDNATRKIPVVGLVENMEMLLECQLTGLTFTHVKCGEYHDVVYDPMFLAFPKEVHSPKFAKAKIREGTDIQLIDNFIVSYFTPTSMHVEGNLKLDKGQKVRVFHNIPDKLFTSEIMVVREMTTKNMFYDYKYAYDLDYTFIDPPVLDPSVASDPNEQKNFKAKQSMYIQELEVAKKKTKEWIKENNNTEERKTIKVLMVDRGLTFLRVPGEDLDDCKFTVRAQTFLSDDMDELFRIMPTMIAIHFEDFDERKYAGQKPEVIKAAQDQETGLINKITAIVNRAKAVPNFVPFIVVFNTTKYDNKFFQQKTGHPYILTNTNPLNLKLVSQMATMLEQKEKKRTEDFLKRKLMELKKASPARYGRLTVADLREEMYFVGKSSQLSRAHVIYEAKMTSITESEITFLCKQELQITAYRCAHPVDMAITVVPTDGKLAVSAGKGEYLYRALIHSVGEDDKKLIRQHVNNIFFSPLNQQREKEQSEFEQLNAAEKEKKAQAELQAIQEAKAEAEQREKEKAEAEARAAQLAKEDDAKKGS